MTFSIPEYHGNGVSERALLIGLQQPTHETINEDEFMVSMTADQKDQAEILCDFLGVSWTTTLNIAIKSALSYAKEKEVKISDLREYPKRIDFHTISHTIKLVLDTKSLIRLEESGMNNQVNECVITGVKLLYDKLVKIKSKKTKVSNTSNS
jgi:hypothetical protein